MEENIKTYEQTIYLPKQEIKAIEELLDYTSLDEIDMEEYGLDRDSTYRTYTAHFEDGYEADIKICVGETNLFVDAVLFDPDGRQATMIYEIWYLEGAYEFEVEDRVYKLYILNEEQKDE